VRLETVDESGKAELTHEIRNEKRPTLVLS